MFRAATAASGGLCGSPNRADACAAIWSNWSGSTNFAIFSRHATRVWLILFKHPTDARPAYEFELDPTANRTGDIWHVHLSGVEHGDLYLYRMDGPYQPEAGHRFNRFKPLLDPYARALTGGFHWDFSRSFGYVRGSPQEDLSFSISTNLAGMPKCIVYGNDGFDWQGAGLLTVR